MEVEELSGWLTHTHVIASQQAQPLLDPFVVFLHGITLLCLAGGRNRAMGGWRATKERREGEKRSAAVLPIVVMAGTGCVLDASRRVGKGAAVVVVVSSGSAQQLQRRVLTDMRKGGGVGGGGDLLLCDKVLFRCCCQHPCYPCGSSLASKCSLLVCWEWEGGEREGGSSTLCE